MISLDNVVQVFHLPVLHRLRADSLRLQLGYCLGQSWCLVGVDDPRGPGCRIRSQRLGQETLGRRDIALRREIKVQGLPTGGNSPIEIAPPAGITVLAYPAQGRISAPSGENRGVINRHAPLKSSFPPDRGSSPRSGSDLRTAHTMMSRRK